ncbi:MAG: 4-(cytidine 5'-diphospho)-2-C-methyl-D-erythritol kinase, partial [Rhodobacteraceae bacterium]|nr:4-(cytidine 5'-diphospho)-2-C-methyl-D-erythritol kinase [Paracoccaceae bacterium]
MTDRAAETEAAPAKVNLTLHVTGRRADGYHLLDSLVVFAPGAADRVTAAAAPELSLTVTGRFAADVPSGAENLVLRAAQAFGAGRGAAIMLEKNLPVASGIGGGSADAAA